MIIRVPAPALSHLRPGLRLAGPARPVIGLQERGVARAAARGRRAAPHTSATGPGSSPHRLTQPWLMPCVRGSGTHTVNWPFAAGIPSAPGKVPKNESNDRFSCMMITTCWILRIPASGPGAWLVQPPRISTAAAASATAASGRLPRGRVGGLAGARLPAVTLPAAASAFTMPPCPGRRPRARGLPRNHPVLRLRVARVRLRRRGGGGAGRAISAATTPSGRAGT
jgi:hypothetical protein